jgi:hypothetical protein
MTTSTGAAFGVYPSSKALHFGAEALRAARFRHTDISVLYSDGSRAVRVQETVDETGVVDECDPSMAQIVGGLSGVAAISIPCDGPYLVGGPLLARLVSSSECLMSSLRAVGIPESALERVEARLRQGGLLLSVQCDDHAWADRAERILLETGAEHVAATRRGGEIAPAAAATPAR